MDTRNESYRLHQLQRINAVLAILSAPITPEARESAARHLESIKPQPRQVALWGGA